MLLPLYMEWNEKINVISRKDIENLYSHHVLHSLVIGKLLTLKPGSDILDLGTGGGFPGIPLAILFPEVNFTLMDGTAKKLKVVTDIVEKTELSNVTILHQRAEEHKGKYDFVVSRAVAAIDKLYIWARPLIKNESNHALPNGLISLKGGQLQTELKSLQKRTFWEKLPIHKYLKEDYFVDKYIIYVQK